MPNNYTDNRQYWDDMSDIDYLSYFIKSWLAFNAWYKSHYGPVSDRQAVDNFKHDTNRARLRTLVAIKTRRRESRPIIELGQDVIEIRNHIGLLHDRLSQYPLLPFNSRAGEHIPISFNEVFISPRTPVAQTTIYNRLTYTVIPTLNNNGQISSLQTSVVNSRGVSMLNLTQTRYNEEELTGHNQMTNLNVGQRERLILTYRDVNPRPLLDLLNRGSDEIECGSYVFRCTSEELFAGTIEILYAMRCMLFHGELEPSKDAQLCYEPAYRIMKHLLKIL